MHSNASRLLASLPLLSLLGPACGPDGAAGSDVVALDAAPGARQIAPLSGSLSGAARPRFRLAGADPALIQVCADHACTFPLTQFTVRGAGRPQVALPSGVVFWRARAPSSDPTAAFTPTWELFVRRGRASDATRGLRFDEDADGYVDAAVRDQNPDAPSDVLHIYRGGSGGLDVLDGATLPLDTSHFGTPVVALGDVNGDGFGDLAVADGRGVAIYAGALSGLGSVPLNVIPPPADVPPSAFGGEVAAAGDVDGDGYGDIFVSDNSFHVWLYRGSPDGVASTPAWTLDRTNTGRNAGILTAADLNGDGFGDLVIRDTGPTGTRQAFRFFRGGSGGLEAPDAGTSVQRPEAPFGSAGDVDGDGIADLVTAESTALSLFPGASDFPPAQPAQSVAVQQRPLIQLGDFDGDGRFDVAATTSLPSSSIFFTDDRIDIYPGNGGGISSAPRVTIVEASVLRDNQLNFGQSLSNGDFDRDGNEELLVGASAPFPTPFFDAATGIVFVFTRSAANLQPVPTLRVAGGPGFGLRVTSGAPERP